MLRTFVAALALVAGSTAPAMAAVAWSKGDFAATLAAARTSKKRVMVDVYATWCAPCQALDTKVFARADVGAAIARQWLALRVDSEAGEGPTLVERYRVTGYPTVLFLEADGTEIDRVTGELTPTEFLRTAEGFAKGEGTLVAAEARYFASGLFDASAAADLSKRASLKGDLDRARFYLDELERIAQAFGDVPHANEGRLAAAVGRGADAMMRVQRSFLKDGVQKQRDGANAGRIAALALLRGAELTYAKYGLLRGAKDAAGAAKVLGDLRLKHAGTAEADAARYELANALAQAGDATAAKKELDAWFEVHSGDKDASAWNGYAWFCFRRGLFPSEGQAIAKQGLERFPKDHGLWDTLAELQFQAGQASEAVASARKAAALAPAESYYKAQIVKFSKHR